MSQFVYLEVASSVEFDHKLMVLEETASMRYSEQSNSSFLCLHVQLSLNVHAHGRSALVHYREQRLVVKQSRHSDSLLLSSRKNVFPVAHRIETLLSFLQVVQLDLAKQLAHVLVVTMSQVPRMRVYYLVAKSSRRKVRSLRNIEEFVHVRTFQNTSSQRPKST